MVTLSLIVLLTLAAPTTAQDSVPWPTEDWLTSTPEEQGMNSQLLADMLTKIHDEAINIHSVLVIRNGYLVTEAYLAPYDETTLHELRSCTKSFISALTGIAIEQGYIDGVDDLMLDYFPERTVENLDEAKQAITLDNLLTMSAGFDWPGGILEPTMNEMTQSPDWLQFVLDRPVVDEPGTKFLYNSGGSNLLAAIIEEATGMSAADYAHQNLFDPLGITQVEWSQDPQEHTLGGFGLRLTPREMAKFGYLYLNNGLWDGEQIVPAEWVTASTTRHIAASPLSDGYGYQWWVDNQGYYMALGYGGQYIIVKPDLNLVVVFTSGLIPNDFFAPETLFTSFILPAAESTTPLPENPEGNAALEAAENALTHPEGSAVPTMPEIAQAISGQTYLLKENDYGFETASLSFEADNPVASFLLNDGPALLVGLDQVYRLSAPSQIGAVPFYHPVMLRGEWENDSRFVIDYQELTVQDWTHIVLTFEEDRLTFQLQYSTGFSTTLRGTRQE
jgi:CubicO group peptidase (beta-lactamase class C family)